MQTCQICVSVHSASRGILATAPMLSNPMNERISSFRAACRAEMDRYHKELQLLRCGPASASVPAPAKPEGGGTSEQCVLPVPADLPPLLSRFRAPSSSSASPQRAAAPQRVQRHRRAGLAARVLPDLPIHGERRCRTGHCLPSSLSGRFPAADHMCVCAASCRRTGASGT